MARSTPRLRRRPRHARRTEKLGPCHDWLTAATSFACLRGDPVFQLSMVASHVLTAQAAAPLVFVLIAISLQDARWLSPTRSVAVAAAIGAVLLLQRNEWAATLGRTKFGMQSTAALVWLTTASIWAFTLLTNSCDREALLKRHQLQCKALGAKAKMVPRCGQGYSFHNACDSMSIFQRAAMEGLATGATYVTLYTFAVVLFTERYFRLAARLLRVLLLSAAVFGVMAVVGETLLVLGVDVPPVWREPFETVLKTFA